MLVCLRDRKKASMRECSEQGQETVRLQSWQDTGRAMRGRRGVLFEADGSKGGLRWEVTFPIKLENVCCGEHSGGEGTRAKAGRAVRWRLQGTEERWRSSLAEREWWSDVGHVFRSREDKTC